MREEEWMDSMLRSWGVRPTEGNPRVDLLKWCEIKGECWVSVRETIKIGPKHIHVQRAAYGLFEGPILKGDVVLALCHTPLCCWAGHLHRIPREKMKRRTKSTVKS